MIWFLLAIIGLLVGSFATLIGSAGGFILVPIVLFLYPQSTPASVTSITLTAAFFNAISGSIAYVHLKRIDYRSGLLFSLASVPGAVIGASITGILSRGVLQIVFGISLLLVAVYLLVGPGRHPPGNVVTGQTHRKIIDTDGNVFTYSFNLTKGMAIAFGMGLIGGLLGIGGGILEVPALTQFLGFPTYVATATSLFLVAITSFAAITVHIISGAFTTSIRQAAALSVGVVIGAQFGARLSHNVSEAWIVRLLAIALATVAIRLLIVPF